MITLETVAHALNEQCHKRGCKYCLTYEITLRLGRHSINYYVCPECFDWVNKRVNELNHYYQRCMETSSETTWIKFTHELFSFGHRFTRKVYDNELHCLQPYTYYEIDCRFDYEQVLNRENLKTTVNSTHGKNPSPKEKSVPVITDDLPDEEIRAEIDKYHNSSFAILKALFEREGICHSHASDLAFALVEITGELSFIHSQQMKEDSPHE